MTAPTGSGSAIRVLIAEDEPHLGAILEQFLTARGFAVTIARNGRAALDRIRTETFDVALLDIVMPEVDGLEVLRQVRETALPPEIIMITGNGTVETALSALRLGAYDVLSKPYRMQEIEALVRRAWEKRMLRHDNVLLRSRLERRPVSDRFLSQYAPLLAVMSVVERVAMTDAAVLVSGEHGTGKRTLARVMHGRSNRAGPLLEMDCAAAATLTADARRDELFGVELDGVAAAASPEAAARPGLLELAANGTLLLHRVNRLPVDLQHALFVALRERGFTRRGGVRRIALDARVVATTCNDGGTLLPELERELDAVRVELPPLRDRVVDVPLLARHFVRQFADARNLELTGDAVAALERHRWPGNVSELRALIERAVLVTTDATIDAATLLLGGAQQVPASAIPISASASASAEPIAEASAMEADGDGFDVDASSHAPRVETTNGSVPTLAELERQHIASVLEHTAWHQGRAAEMLGISPKTLYRKIREYGFRRPSGRGA